MKRYRHIYTLSEDGWVHWLVPALVIIIVALVGLKLLTQSHAENQTTVNTAPKTVEISNASNGTTIHLKAGTGLVVNLTSLYWPPLSPPAGHSESSTGPWQNFTSSNHFTMKIIGDPVYTRTDSTTDPGAINISSEQAYQAVWKGTSTIEAESITQRVCGAGIDCPTYAFANHFTVTVDVTGSVKGTLPGCVPQPGYACPL